METGAIIRDNRRYRLWRIWDQKKPMVLFILLNPSIGDGKRDDPTIRRLIYFSKTHHFGGFYLGNLYSSITPYPKILYKTNPSEEKENLRHLKKMKQACEKVVFAWGRTESTPNWLVPLVDEPWCFGKTQNGSPKHPLYLPKTTRLVPFYLETV